MNTNRLMSRASVAVMAAFAPKKDDGSSLPPGAERVEDAGGDAGDGADELGGLSPEEQAQYEAMQAGRDPGGKEDIVPEGEPDGDGADDEPEAGDEDTTPEAPAAGEGDPPPVAADGAKPAPQTISYKKHQRELAKIRKAQDDLQARLDGALNETKKEREERLKLNERTQMLLEAINTRQAAPPAAPAAPKVDDDPQPDKEADPIGYLEWKGRQQDKIIEELRTGRQQEQQQTAAEREEMQVYRTYEADLTREAQADPAFVEAFNHLRETRYTELGFIFADIDINDKAAVDAALTPEQQVALSENIQRTFHNEQMLIARQSLQAKKSPAKVVANLARARGWKPAPPQQQQQDPPPAPTNGAAPAKPGNGAAPPRAAAPGSVKDQLQAIREGQETSRSLSDAGGSPGGSITPERLAEMPDDEFEALYDSMSKGKFDRLMGKPSVQ